MTRRDRADARSRVRDAPPAAGVGDGGAGEGRAPSRSPRLLPPDGRRPRARRRRGRRRGVAAAGGLAGRAAVSAAVGRVARRWRAGSACRGASATHRAALAGGCARAPADRATDVAVLRDVRRPRGPRAAARQLPGRRRARSSRIARRPRTSACICCPRWPRAISAGSARSTPSSGWRPRSRRCNASSASAATSTTGTTRRRCEPLEPKYVSSVDSGNLAGHLIALAHACRGDGRPPAPRPRRRWPGSRTPRCSSGWRRASPRRRRAGPGRHARVWRRRSTPSRRPSRRRPLRRGRVACAAGGRCEARAHTVAGRRAGAGRRGSRRARGRRCSSGRRRSCATRRQPHARPRPARARSLVASRVLARSARAHGRRPWTSAFSSIPMRKLFAIGYRVADGTLDPGRYDLLASEARLASFVAIAKGDVPVSHWFRLGRALTPVELDSVLVSWSGSMFEYLMPALVMRAPAGSLLEQTARLVVGRQISVRRRARRAVGRVGVGLQRARSRDDLPVFELRRAGARAATRAQRGRRHRALRDGTGRDGRSAGRGPQFPSAWRRPGPAAPTASTRRSTTPRPGCPRAPSSRWFAPTWRTTRAC